MRLKLIVFCILVISSINPVFGVNIDKKHDQEQTILSPKKSKKLLRKRAKRKRRPILDAFVIGGFVLIIIGLGLFLFGLLNSIWTLKAIGLTTLLSGWILLGFGVFMKFLFLFIDVVDLLFN